MRSLFLVGPLLLLAGFSPPNPRPFPPQGVQEAPPRSWIPERAEKAPIIVTPELPNKSAPDADGAAKPSDRHAMSVITPTNPEYCSARVKNGAYPSEAFVNAYNAAKTAIAAQKNETGLARALEAESLATSFSMLSATLGLQVLAFAELGDSARLEEAIAKRTALGCLTGAELSTFEIARKMIERRAAQQ